MIKIILIKLIRYYQETISPDHSYLGRQKYPNGFCRYYPSCSEYTKNSVMINGVSKGLIKGVWRVLRCNPFSPGGYDPAK